MPYVHKCAQVSGSLHGCMVYRSVHTVCKGVCRCVYTQRCAGICMYAVVCRCWQYPPPGIRQCPRGDFRITLGGGGLERNVSSIKSPERSCRGPAVSSQQLTTIPNFGFPGSDTLFRLPQSPGCMQASVHADKINFPIFPQPQIHPLYLLPCSVCATLRDCAGLTEETLSKASSQEQPVADRGLRSREVTVLSQSRLLGEGYRASGKGGQVLFGELLPREA